MHMALQWRRRAWGITTWDQIAKHDSGHGALTTADALLWYKQVLAATQLNSTPLSQWCVGVLGLVFRAQILVSLRCLRPFHGPLADAYNSKLEHLSTRETAIPCRRQTLLWHLLQTDPFFWFTLPLRLPTLSSSHVAAIEVLDRCAVVSIH